MMKSCDSTRSIGATPCRPRVTSGQTEPVDVPGGPEEGRRVLFPRREVRRHRLLGDAVRMAGPEIERQADELLDELRCLLLRRRGLDHAHALDGPRVET